MTGAAPGIRTAAFESHQHALDALANARWTDGLPMVPATRALVDAMIAGGDLQPPMVVGTLAERDLSLHVWQAAACAVMAGCRPEHFPVVLATWEALFDPRFNLPAAMTSSGGAAIAAVVSGPIAKRIGMNGGAGVFSPGNVANATIGRAIRLGMLSALDAIPDEFDASAFGHAGKFGFHFAERDPPAGWPPLAQQLGFPDGDSTVTVMAADAPRQVSYRWRPVADALLRTLAAAMKDPSHNATGTGACCIVALGPEHTSILCDAGLTPQAIRQRLSELSCIGIDELAAAGIDHAHARGHYGAPDADGRILTARPEHILVVTAGGAGSGWSAVIPAYTRLSSCHPASRPIRVAGNPPPVAGVQPYPLDFL